MKYKEVEGVLKWSYELLDCNKVLKVLILNLLYPYNRRLEAVTIPYFMHIRHHYSINQ